MNILNKIGYKPVDDNSPSGYRRPPKNIAAICDYFAVLGYIEDDGEFLHAEMRLMLTKPEEFFPEPPKSKERKGPFGDPLDDPSDPIDWDAMYK